MHCPVLRELDLSGCHCVNDQGIIWLCYGINNHLAPLSQHLIHMDISDTSVTRHGVETALIGLPCIQQLTCADLSDAIGSIVLKSGDNPPTFRVRVLDISWNNDHVSGLKRQSVAAAMSDCCKHVHELRVRGDLSSSSLRSLSQFTDVTRLQLTGCDHDKSAAYISGLGHLLGVIGSCLCSLVFNEISAASVPLIAICCPSLRNFVFFVSSESVAESDISVNLPANCKPFAQLQLLRLHAPAMALSFPAEYLKLLLQFSMRLEQLYLTNINSLTDDLFVELFSVNPLSCIRVVELHACNQLSGAAVKTLLEVPNNLNRLFTLDCSLIALRHFQLFQKIVKQHNYSVELSWR